MTTKIKYQIQAAGESATVYIYGGIGMPDQNADMVWPEEIVEDVAAITAGSIDVRISSVGGDTSGAAKIYQALVEHPAKVTTIVDGDALSAGSMILQAGDTRRAKSMAMIMVHGPLAWAEVNLGNADELKKALEAHAERLVSAYTRNERIAEETVRGWIEDGKDHNFSAQQALDAGLIDEVISEEQIAASAPNEYRIAAMGGKPQPEANMATDDKTNAGPPPAPENTVKAYRKAKSEGEKAGAALERKRIADITELKSMTAFAAPEVQAVLDQAIDTDGVTKAQAMEQALLAAEQVSDFQPVNAVPQDHGIFNAQPARPNTAPRQQITGGTSNHVEGIRNAMLIKTGVNKDPEFFAKERSSEFLAMSIVDIMRFEMQRAGIRAAGTREDIARHYCNTIPIMAAGPSHGTDHLTGILADVMHKATMQGWDGAGETWSTWTQQGTLSDYREAKRANLAKLDKLAKMEEHEEWTYGDLADVSQGITGYFHGRKYGFTIQAIVNDDLSEITRAFNAWGEVSNVTVGDAVFNTLLKTQTSSFGQIMDEDSKAIFHADHSNYVTSGGAPANATITAGRTAMMTQTDQNSRVISARPRYLLHPVALQQTVWTLLNSQELTGTTTANTLLPTHNHAASLGLMPVEEYRFDTGLTGTYAVTANAAGWILAADRRTVEVAGVGGPLTPRIEQSTISNIPGITYEISMPFGVAALDYRGLYYNDGA